jgi:hypothetical protein
VKQVALKNILSNVSGLHYLKVALDVMTKKKKKKKNRRGTTKGRGERRGTGASTEREGESRKWRQGEDGAV